MAPHERQVGGVWLRARELVEVKMVPLERGAGRVGAGEGRVWQLDESWTLGETREALMEVEEEGQERCPTRGKNKKKNI